MSSLWDFSAGPDWNQGHHWGAVLLLALAPGCLGDSGAATPFLCDLEKLGICNKYPYISQL